MIKKLEILENILFYLNKEAAEETKKLRLRVSPLEAMVGLGLLHPNILLDSKKEEKELLKEEMNDEFLRLEEVLNKLKN